MSVAQIKAARRKRRNDPRFANKYAKARARIAPKASRTKSRKK